LKPLLHTWSLGVEEQFYIVMPLVLAAIARWQKAQYLPWLIALAIGSFLVSCWGVIHAPTASFYLLPTRFWELALGAIVSSASRWRTQSRSTLEGLSIFGIASIGLGIFFLSEEKPFPGWNALYPCFGTALVIYSGVSGQSVVSRLLSTSPMVFIGKISYSFYLWHWPALALTKYQLCRNLTPAETAAALFISFIVSVFAWRCIENPFRDKRLFDSRVLFAMSASAVVIIACAGTAGVLRGGFPSRYPSYVELVVSGQERYNDGRCLLEPKQSFADWGADSCFLSRGNGPNVLLWGDSFAAHYVPGIVDSGSKVHADVLQFTASGCAPIFGYATAGIPHCREFNDHVPKLLKEFHISNVVMSGRWESLFKRGVAPDDVAATAARLRSMGVTVYVIGQSPVFSNDPRALFAKSGLTAVARDASAQLSFSADVNKRLESVLPAKSFIDPLNSICDQPMCTYRRDGQFLVTDIGHFSSFGSKLAVERYFPFFFKGGEASLGAR